MSKMTVPEALEVVKIRLAHVEADDELIVAWHMVEEAASRPPLLSRVWGEVQRRLGLPARQ